MIQDTIAECTWMIMTEGTWMTMTEGTWMIMTEGMMICTDMTGDMTEGMTEGMIEGMIEADIINIHIATDTVDVKTQFGGYSGLSSFCKNN